MRARLIAMCESKAAGYAYALLETREPLFGLDVERVPMECRNKAARAAQAAGRVTVAGGVRAGRNRFQLCFVGFNMDEIAAVLGTFCDVAPTYGTGAAGSWEGRWDVDRISAGVDWVAAVSRVCDGPARKAIDVAIEKSAAYLRGAIARTIGHPHGSHDATVQAEWAAEYEAKFGGEYKPMAPLCDALKREVDSGWTPHVPPGQKMADMDPGIIRRVAEQVGAEAPTWLLADGSSITGTGRLHNCKSAIPFYPSIGTLVPLPPGETRSVVRMPPATVMIADPAPPSRPVRLNGAADTLAHFTPAPPAERPPLFWQDNEGTLCSGDPPAGFLGTERILSAEEVCKRYRAVRWLLESERAALEANIEARKLPTGPAVVCVRAETTEKAADAVLAINRALWEIERRTGVKDGLLLIPLAKSEGLCVDPEPDYTFKRAGYYRLTADERAVVEAMRKGGGGEHCQA